MHARLAASAVLAGSTVLLAGCASLTAGTGATGNAGPAASPATGSAATATASPAAARHAPAHGGLTLVTEPAAGLGRIYRLINSARKSVDLTMYELTDATAEADLAHDAARGVTVRVVLDRHLEHSANTAAYDYLRRHGVHVHWAPASTTYHQKTLTIDAATSVVMTLNFTAQYYATSRDFAVIDTRRADVAAIVTTFDADYAGRPISPPDGTDLVWSPTNAQSAVLAIIGGARHTLAVEDEEMADPAVTSALAGAARRGVRVRVVMTADSEWDSAFRQLTAAGVHVRLYPDSDSALYIHAKAIVADAGHSGQRVLVGSQNFSAASLDYNRELGILTADKTIVSAISAVLARDYAGGTSYAAPSAGGSGTASCTATATVYDAARNENNIYVHSDQPDTTATASAAGISHSYQTDGSGYALIYLNGPRPGARVTVTVGDATCTTTIP